MNDITTYHELILRDIRAESENATADSIGCPLAMLCNTREEQIAGMIQLAQLLGLADAFVDALDEHRWTLINAAGEARRR